MPWPAPLGSGSDAAFSVTLANAVDGASGSTNVTSFIMDDGTTLTLDGLPGGSDLTVINGSTLDLDGNSVAVKTVTLTAGSINDGAVAASQYYAVRNGSIAANLGGGPLTMSGGGEVDLTGNNSFSGRHRRAERDGKPRAGEFGGTCGLIELHPAPKHGNGECRNCNQPAT